MTSFFNDNLTKGGFAMVNEETLECPTCGLTLLKRETTNYRGEPLWYCESVLCPSSCSLPYGKNWTLSEILRGYELRDAPLKEE